MSLTRWFSRGGRSNRVARALGRGTAVVCARSRREVGRSGR